MLKISNLYPLFVWLVLGKLTLATSMRKFRIPSGHDNMVQNFSINFTCEITKYYCHGKMQDRKCIGQSWH